MAAKVCNMAAESYDPATIGTCIETKEDLEYDDLCTLEGLLSYFKHDATLDEEIAYLKEQCLITKINGLNESLRMANKSRDAMMLMSFINPDSIPKNAWNQIITAAANRPSMLLNYIDADVELIWPVSKRMDDGHYVEISHGLRSKDDEMEDE